MTNFDDLITVRKNMYDFFSRLYLEPPSDDLDRDIRSKEFIENLENAALNQTMRNGVEMIKGEKPSGLGKEYSRIFVDPYHGIVNPYQSNYTEEENPGRVRLKLNRFYREAGLSKVSNVGEPEDHFSLELGFMAKTCQKIIDETIEQKRELLMTQREFLLDYLLPWAPEFLEKVASHPQAAYFKGFAQMTNGFLEFDIGMIEDLLSTI